MAMAVKAPITGLRISSSPAAPSCVRGVIMLKARPFRPLFFGHGVGTPKYTGTPLSISVGRRCYSYGVGALSYANALVSFFEDPEKIMEQSVTEMNGDLVRMRQATAQILASQKQLENKYKAAHKASEDWYERAKLALGKGDEDLSREALKRRKSFDDNANALKTQLDQQKVIVDNLVANTRLLESKIQEAKSKKDTLKARAQAAKTATKVSEMLGNVNTSSALSAFEKMEEKVLAMEYQAEAIYQLTSDDLEGKFAMLETDSVDDDLASLKKQISGNTQALKGELPPGRTPVTSLKFQDREIETKLNESRQKVKEY
ncbi:Membrane-associated protein vipp1, chloroplastic [Castilleja foliolosa]|uniref:Membrane-associated protein vipp1, chloroplastic n=1 Tax=Castilleja foliolosa TaxID=1961234 RepID=A0ABD3EAI4_9LAMI